MDARSAKATIRATAARRCCPAGPAGGIAGLAHPRPEGTLEIMQVGLAGALR